MEYIRKQSLLADLNETTPHSYFAFETMVRVYPTEDVAPVIHAHWIEKVGMQPTGQHGEHYCSACCGCALRGRPGSGRDIQTKFCPHCGAKMDEVVDDE